MVSEWLRSAPRRLDRRHELVVEYVLGDLAHNARAHDAVSVDDEGLRHAIDAPFDARASVGVERDALERVSVLGEEGADLLRAVLLHQAVEREVGPSAERGEQRRLAVTGHAPRREHVDDADMARSELARAEALRGAVERRKLQTRRGLADQRRGQRRIRILFLKMHRVEKEARERREARGGKDVEP